jgi:hypothetical protein
MILLDMPWIDSIGAFIAILAFIISILSFQISKRRHKIDISVSLIKSRQEMYLEIRNWADVTIKTMTETSTLCEYDPTELEKGEFFKRRVCIINDLSYLIDKGRLYLPNIDHEEYGTEKPGAYRGLRQAALTKVVEFFNLALKLSSEDKSQNKKLQPTLNDKKKEFVSEIQEVLQVRQMEKEFEELLQQHTRELQRK